MTVATLAQLAVRPWRWAFWTLAPINMLLIASTVLLGYHYIIDVPAGLLVAAMLGPWVPADRPARAPPSD